MRERKSFIFVYEVIGGLNALDNTRNVINMYHPRLRLDTGTWGVMGIGMGYSIGASVTGGKQVLQQQRGVGLCKLLRRLQPLHQFSCRKLQRETIQPSIQHEHLLSDVAYNHA